MQVNISDFEFGFFGLIFECYDDTIETAISLKYFTLQYDVKIYKLKTNRYHPNQDVTSPVPTLTFILAVRAVCSSEVNRKWEKTHSKLLGVIFIVYTYFLKNIRRIHNNLTKKQLLNSALKGNKTVNSSNQLSYLSFEPMLIINIIYSKRIKIQPDINEPFSTN